VQDLNEVRAYVNLVEQIFIIWLRTFTTKSASGPQKSLAALCPYKGMHFEYSGVNQSSPVRNDFQKANKDADGLTEKEQNVRKTRRNKERREDFAPDEAATEKAKHAAYSKLVNKPVQKFKKQAAQAGMTQEAIDKTVKAFQLLARLAKARKQSLPLAEEHLVITR
jgi:hypothetical protein